MQKKDQKDAPEIRLLLALTAKLMDTFIYIQQKRNDEDKMDQCIFCKIIKGDIPSTKIFENKNILAFQDLHPLAPIHLLFIAKSHSVNVNEMINEEPAQLAEVFKAIAEYTKQAGLDKSGFRVVTNTGRDSGQTVFHTHFHVLGGGHLRGFGA